jgi:hypothetical protein
MPGESSSSSSKSLYEEVVDCECALPVYNRSTEAQVRRLDYQLELLSCRPSTQEFRKCLAQNPVYELKDDSPTITNNTY